MKKVRRMITVLLAVSLMMGLTACMGGVKESTPTPVPTSTPGEPTAGVTEVPEITMPPMDTSTPITLRYAIWDDYQMTRELAKKFNEKYPNITVEIVELPLDGYMDALSALAASGDMPDLFQFLSLSATITNGWMADITEYWEADSETDQYYESLVPSSYIDGERVFRFAGEYLPYVAYLDRTVFTKLNEPMPSFDWTYEQMIDLIKKMTRPDQGIYGYNYMLGPITWGPIVLTDGLSEFGWDGNNYHLSGPWADAVNFVAEGRRLGYQALQNTDAWAASSGDASMWPGNSGLVAMQLDAWWTLNNIYAKSEAKDKGIDMVPYVVPKGASAQTDRKPAAIDFAAISSGTDHPREAYEALKYLTWAKDGWIEKIKLFPTLLNEAGEREYDFPNCFPLIDDDELYAEFRKLFPADEPAYDAFFEHSRSPVPLGGQGILGFDLWLSEIYQGGDYNGVTNVEESVWSGAINANDAVTDLEIKGRQYFENALNDFYLIYGKPNQ